MFREWEEWSAGRSRRRGERLGRAQDEPKSALQADKVETSRNYQGKVKSPALQNRGQGTQIRPWATTVPPASSIGAFPSRIRTTPANSVHRHGRTEFSSGWTPPRRNG